MSAFKSMFCVAAIMFAALTGNARAADTLRLALQAPIASFDPDNSFATGGLCAVTAVYEGLVQYAPGTTKVVGLLAKDWTISPDAKTYTFHLVEGVKFQDGTPMTAADVVTSLKRRDTKGFVLWYFLADVDTITAPDAKTVVITLKGPQTSFLDALASPWGPKVISAKALAEHDGGDMAKTWLKTNAVGTGPYRLTTFSGDQHYVLQRNDDYWGAKPHFATIDIAVIPDIGQQILKLRGGEIDIVPTGYPVAQLKQLPSGFKVSTFDNMGMIVGFVNPASPLATNDALRQAVLTAIAPSHWAVDAFGPYAVPAGSLYPAAMLKPAKPIVFPSDMKAAKAAVQKIGPVKLRFAYTADNVGLVRLPAEIMIADLASIGVDATAQTVQQSEPFSYAKNQAGAPDMLLARINPDAAHPANQIEVFFTTGAPVNFFGFSDPAADKVIAQADDIADRAKADPLYEEGARMIVQKGGFIPLADLKEIIVHTAKLKNIKTRPSFPPGNVDFSLVTE
jgi:peptide/nickel transport system substrate-binding protein